MRPGQGAGCPSSSRSYRAGTRIATAWVRLYTHGVEPGLASARTDQIDLELWEHALVADRRWSALHGAISLVLRTAAGVPRDLSWRHAVRSEGAATAPPVHLLVRRHRQRFWVPLQAGHLFDQTNGMTETGHG